MFTFFKSDKKTIPDLSFLATDMHSHLLPSLDDGVQSIDKSIEFIKQLQGIGYKKLICTPHILTGVHENSAETILPTLEKLKQRLVQENISIAIEAAAEYMVDYELETRIKKNEQILTFGKNYVLIEMSYVAASPNIHNIIFDLKLAGLQPVLAHPERYNYYHEKFSFYHDFKDRGCLLQLNLLSLSGYYGKNVQKIGEKLLKENMIDFIGTDIHHETHLNMVKELASSTKFKKLISNTYFLNKEL